MHGLSGVAEGTNFEGGSTNRPLKGVSVSQTTNILIMEKFEGHATPSHYSSASLESMVGWSYNKKLFPFHSEGNKAGVDKEK